MRLLWGKMQIVSPLNFKLSSDSLSIVEHEGLRSTRFLLPHGPERAYYTKKSCFIPDTWHLRFTPLHDWHVQPEAGKIEQK